MVDLCWVSFSIGILWRRQVSSGILICNCFNFGSILRDEIKRVKNVFSIALKMNFFIWERMATFTSEVLPKRLRTASVSYRVFLGSHLRSSVTLNAVMTTPYFSSMTSDGMPRLERFDFSAFTARVETDFLSSAGSTRDCFTKTHDCSYIGGCGVW